MPTINGHLYYTCIATPTRKYESEDTEYKVTVLVDKPTAVAFAERFPKQKPKVVLAEDFQDKFRVEPPAEYEGQAKLYTITLKTNSHLNDGTPKEGKSRPRTFMQGPNGKLFDCTDTLVGNGSKGVVEYAEAENKYGVFAKLRNIRVDDLIEVKGGSGTELGEVDEVSPPPKVVKGGFDDMEDDEIAPAPKKAPAKAKARPAPQIDADDDEDIPF